MWVFKSQTSRPLEHLDILAIFKNYSHTSYTSLSTSAPLPLFSLFQKLRGILSFCLFLSQLFSPRIIILVLELPLFSLYCVFQIHCHLRYIAVANEIYTGTFVTYCYQSSYLCYITSEFSCITG